MAKMTIKTNSNLSLHPLLTLAVLPLLAALAFSLTGCGPAASTAQGEGVQKVAVGCGSCIYEMPGVESCEAAVKIDGKPYLLTGTKVDAHTIGLCSGEKTAEIVGKVEGDKFVASSFKLVD